MYKKLYLDYLEKELKELLPRDYSVKVVQEVSYSADAEKMKEQLLQLLDLGLLVRRLMIQVQSINRYYSQFILKRIVLQ